MFAYDTSLFSVVHHRSRSTDTEKSMNHNEPRKTYKRKPLEKLTLRSPFKQTLSVQIFQRSLRQILLGPLLNNPAFI